MCGKVLLLFLVVLILSNVSPVLADDKEVWERRHAEDETSNAMPPYISTRISINWTTVTGNASLSKSDTMDALIAYSSHSRDDENFNDILAAEGVTKIKYTFNRKSYTSSDSGTRTIDIKLDGADSQRFDYRKFEIGNINATIWDWAFQAIGATNITQIYEIYPSTVYLRYIYPYEELDWVDKGKSYLIRKVEIKTMYAIMGIYAYEPEIPDGDYDYVEMSIKPIVLETDGTFSNSTITGYTGLQYQRPRTFVTYGLAILCALIAISVFFTLARRWRTRNARRSNVEARIRNA